MESPECAGFILELEKRDKAGTDLFRQTLKTFDPENP